MALPTASTPGYGTITRNGRTFVGCDCTIAFLLAGERLGLARGLLKEGLDIVQLTGLATQSGNTHAQGAAFDVLQYGPEWVTIWREMGASFWPRLDPNPTRPGDLWDNNQHGHGGIDCPHDSLIAYQMTAYWRGYSGLGQATSGPYAGQWGYGSKDPNPWRPKVRRSWRDGIAWADAQTKALTPPPAPTGRLFMSLTPAQEQTILSAAQLVLERVPARNVTAGGVTKKAFVLDNADGDYLRRLLVSIADKVGAPVDVDENAIAAQLLAGLKPAVADAVKAAVAAGTPTADLADAVVARLGARLAGPA